MIIRHSLKLLEQLSEIEVIIQKLESAMVEKGMDFDREQILLKLIRGQEGSPSRPPKND